MILGNLEMSPQIAAFDPVDCEQFFLSLLGFWLTIWTKTGAKSSLANVYLLVMRTYILPGKATGKKDTQQIG